MMYSDGYVHLVATAGVEPALFHDYGLSCSLVVPHISALVTVWGVTTPLKLSA